MTEFESAVLARLDRIDATLARLGAGPDPEIALLDRIAALMVGRAFTAREIVDRAEVDPGMRQAVVAAVGVDQTSRRLGWLLKRSERAERVGDCADGALWVLRQNSRPA